MVTSGYGLRRDWYGCTPIWFDRIIRRTPHGPHAMPVRASYRPRTGISNGFFRFYGARTRPVRDPQECRMEPLRKKSHTGVVFGRMGLYGSRTDCSRFLNRTRPVSLYIKILRAPFGETKFVWRSTGPVRALWVHIRFLFKTDREQPVRGPGVWCDWGISRLHWTNC